MQSSICSDRSVWFTALFSLTLFLNDPTPQLQAETPQSRLKNRVVAVQKGTSARTLRNAAQKGLPLEKLSAEKRQQVEALLQSTSLFRQLPVYSFECNPGLYRFFLTNPDVVVSIWQALGISEFEMWPTAKDTYRADAGDGSFGIVEELYRSDLESLVLCNGVYKSPLLVRPIRAKALMHLEARLLPQADGTTNVEHRIHLFVTFPSQTVETAAKIISPVSNLIVDRNFREVSLFIHMMSMALERQPGWVERLVGKMEDVTDTQKKQFLQLAARAFVDAKRRELAKTPASDKLNVETLLKPPTQPAETNAEPKSLAKKSDPQANRKDNVASKKGAVVANKKTAAAR